MSMFNSTKNKKMFIKCAQNRGAYVQCMNNHYAQFEYQGMETVGVTDYTNQTPPKHFEQKKIKTPKNEKNIFVKCAQNRRCTF